MFVNEAGRSVTNLDDLTLDSAGSYLMVGPPPSCSFLLLFSLPLGLGEEPDLLCAASLLKLWH